MSRAVPRQHRSREKRERILAATALLLEQLPYDQIGTKLIAERSGVAVGSLYRYFPDKAAIAHALLLRSLDRMVELLDAQLTDPPADAVAMVNQIVDAFADFYRDDPGFRWVWFDGGLGGAHPDRATADANDRALAERLHAALTDRYAIPAETVPVERITVAVRVADLLLNEAFRTDPSGNAWHLAELKLLLHRYLAL